MKNNAPATGAKLSYALLALFGVLLAIAMVIPLLEVLHWRWTASPRTLKIHFDGPRAFVDTSTVMSSSNTLSSVSVSMPSVSIPQLT